MKNKFFAYSLLVSVLLQVINLIFPVLIGQLVDLLSLGRWNDYLTLLMLICSIPIFQGLLEWAKLYSTTLFTQQKAASIRQLVSKLLLRLPISFFSKSKTGELITRSTDDIQQVIDYEKMKVEVIEQSALILTLSIILYIINPLLMVIVIVGGICFIIQSKLISPKLSKNYESTMSMQDKYNEYIRERTQIIPLTVVTGNYNWELNQINSIVEREKDIGRNLTKINFWNNTILKTIESLVTGSIYLIASYLLIKQTITLGQLIIAVSFYFPLVQSFTLVSNWFHRINKYNISKTRIEDILSQQIDNVQEGEVNFPEINKIEFKNVTFSYPDKEPLLKEVNFTIRKGDILAIVGASGSGKSTISELLLKFHGLTNGKIILNDSIDLFSLNGEKWRKRVAYAPQIPYFFTDTIYNNLMYGNDSENISESTLLHWARKLNIDKVIESKDEGFNTNISNTYSGFSGGQKQRLSLLRTLIKSNIDILIVDEPTSSLDYISENKTMEVINEKKQVCAVVIIAHRLSTIINADKIIVLKDGEIVESGTHQQLLEKNGEYSRLFEIELANQKE